MNPLTSYQPPSFDAVIELDLSRNEGRPWALEGLELVDDLTLVSRYPDTGRLRDAIAERHQVAPDRVLITAGGDDALARCFLSRAGCTAVATTPSFEMVERYRQQTGGAGVYLEWWDEDFPIDRFLEASPGAGMAVIVSPNNPTGSVVTETDLRKVADSFPFVVLDAAYADFADEDLTPAALEMDNLVVIRTLSKAYGLAGLRVGYLLGEGDTVAGIGAFGSPYPVSGVSAWLAESALAANEDSLRLYRDEIREKRSHLTDTLTELGAAPLPSQANFVLATDVQPDWLIPAAASLGVGLRAFPARPDLARCVRITVPGAESDFERLAATLRTVLAPQALIFDLDGVVADVSGSYLAAVIDTAACFGATVTVEDVAEAKAEGNCNDDWQLARRLCHNSGIEVAIADIVERFQHVYEGTKTKPGLKRMERLLIDLGTLQRWSSRLPLAVVTGRPRGEADSFLDRFGLEDVFTTVVTREDAALKPEPAPVRLALERLGVGHAWMVGDTRDDVLAARAAGVVPIGVLPPGDPPEIARRGLRGAAVVLDSIDELEEVLDGQRI